MDVVVTGIGLRCCLGSLEESWRALLAGKSGIKFQQPFVSLPCYPLGLIGNNPASLVDLLHNIVNDSLKDAQLTIPLTDCGVVIGSSRSFQGIWEQFIQQASPLFLENWLETLPHQGAILTARQIGTTEPILAPMAACATGIWAIFQGFELIKQGRCQRVIVGAVESPITPLTLVGFKQMGALATTGCYPFDERREGLVLGEGGAVFVLESAELALSRGAAIYGQILGFGLTCDAAYISAPSPDYSSGMRAIKDCLKRSNLTVTDIDYIHAHGTSTKLNDAREAALIQGMFPAKVAVSSTKGSTGHTLGASAALGVAFCLLALKEQQLPPCVGLKIPEFELELIRVSRQENLRQALCLSFGFGGQNGVVALGNYKYLPKG